MEDKVYLKPFVHIFKDNLKYIFFDYGSEKNISINSKINLDFYMKSFGNDNRCESLKKEYKENFSYLKEMDEYLFKKGFLYITDTEIENKIQESLLYYTNHDFDLQKSIKKMKDIRIAIVGIGGTGSWVCQQISMNQFGYLKIIDPDKIDYSNLQRQTLYTLNDVGNFKVDAMKQHIQSQNKEINIDTSYKKINDYNDCVEEFNQIDLIVCTADEPSSTEISKLINLYCIKEKKKFITTLGYTNAVVNLPFTYLPSKYQSSCVNCFYNTNEFFKKHELINKGIGGAPLTPISSILGSLIMLEVLNITISDDFSIFDSIKGTFNIHNLNFSTQTSQKDPNCDLCSKE
ncbi:ThiF family adenylyltransferase [Macrococcus caseolyticus]|uniref:ThiF family adenylyltransferase n=1 Tax=Macrococcoides caseolyticum TaxID=69966 RepID=UPI0024BC5441|nr:ThiF family adenylyltransferase [Macrococcus caseolyticus]MDJ1110499.1 ThiF family adenylyltransferase [Macrococcus caseolyticus]